MYSKRSGQGDGPGPRPVRTSDRLRRRPKVFSRTYLYYTPGIIRPRKGKTKTRTAASRIAKMLGNRAVRAANANSVPTNLRRSTRKRRLSAHLEDYTDSSGSEDEDLMRPAFRPLRNQIHNSLSQDELSSSKHKKIVETKSTPRREGLRPRRSRTIIKKSLAPESGDEQDTSEEKAVQDETENGNDIDDNDADDGQNDNEAEDEGDGDGEGEDEGEEDDDDDDEGEEEEEEQDGRRRYDLRNRAEVRRLSMEEGKQRPRSPRRVLHQGMGTKVNRDVRKGGSRVHKRHRLSRAEDSDDSLLVDEMDQGPTIPWARGGSRSGPPWLFGGLEMHGTTAWGLNVAASGWGHQGDALASLTSGVQTAGPSSKGGADIQPLQVDETVSFDDIGGLSGYIDALKEMVFFPLLYPDFFASYHITPPRGVLLCGPPGTGKTLIAVLSVLSLAQNLSQPMGDPATPPSSELAAMAIVDGASLKHPFSDRVPVRSIVCRPDGGAGLAGNRVRAGGWVKTGREQGKGSFAFLEVNDGSCPANLQVIVDAGVEELSTLVQTGTCVSVEGVLKVPPEGAKQKIELRVERVLHVGPTDPAKYPIPKTKLSLEFLRDHVHLRPRTNTISAVARIRNALAFATHSFFQEHGFLYVHTPIITTSDCEGAGEMFQATTLINEAEKLEKELIENPPPTEANVEAARLTVTQRGEIVAQLKAAKATRDDISASVAELKIAKENLSRLVERAKLKPGIPKKDGKIDYTQDFFARQAFLTVSGQLQVETYACAVTSVYTFGPTFRAENSHTSRHLAEFWMVEPEIAFADLQDDMNCAEAYVKYMCGWLLDKCFDDMELMAKLYDKGCIDRLRMVSSTPFERISYTEAVRLLEEAVKGGKEFEKKVEWGIDLASEHERYLTEDIFKKPVIVYNYPKGIKAFYMRLNDDSKTVAAMDILVPKVGELIGGSQREERYEVIQRRIAEMGLPLEPYEWYLDLRRYGPIWHSRFNFLVELLLLKPWPKPRLILYAAEHSGETFFLDHLIHLLASKIGP